MLKASHMSKIMADHYYNTDLIKITDTKDLAEHLLSNKPWIRLAAEKRLSELKNKLNNIEVKPTGD